MNSGGLIEASRLFVGTTPASPATEFPPVNSGGLIEAWRWCNYVEGVGWQFPPVNSGGLIEA